MKREYPDRPLVGVGAVIISDGRVVLARRGKPPRRGQWSLPGGVVELGETLRAAAVREAHEETGLEVETSQVIEVLDRIVPDIHGNCQYHYVLIDFLCRPLGGLLRAGEDAMEVAWASEDEFPRYELEPVVIEVIRKGFAAAKSSQGGGLTPSLRV